MSQPISKSQSVDTLYNQLAQPFDLRFLKYRVGATSKKKDKAIALFYLDAREVTRRLNEVCGLDGWSTKQEAVVSGGNLLGTRCELSIRMPYKDSRDNYVWNTKTDFGEPSKTAPLKGSASDALKRAAVLFGVGRYLYYIPNQWFKINEFKQFEDDPKKWLEQYCKWAIPNYDEEMEKWEDIAMMEYDPEKDIDLDELEFEDEEAQTILTEAKAKRDELLKYLENKKSEDKKGKK